MAQRPAPNFSRSAARLVAVDRFAGDGQRHSQRNGVPYPDRAASARLRAIQTDRAPSHLAPALIQVRKFLSSWHAISHYFSSVKPADFPISLSKVYVVAAP